MRQTAIPRLCLNPYDHTSFSYSANAVPSLIPNANASPISTSSTGNLYAYGSSKSSEQATNFRNSSTVSRPPSDPASTLSEPATPIQVTASRLDRKAMVDRRVKGPQLADNGQIRLDVRSDHRMREQGGEREGWSDSHPSYQACV